MTQRINCAEVRNALLLQIFIRYAIIIIDNDTFPRLLLQAVSIVIFCTFFAQTSVPKFYFGTDVFLAWFFTRSLMFL